MATDNTPASAKPAINLLIRRSSFLRIAPMLLWLLVIFIPLLIGGDIIFSAKEQQLARTLAGVQQQLITRAKELEIGLGEESLIKERLAMEPIGQAYNDALVTKDYLTPLQSFPMIRALPDFTADVPRQLNTLSDFFASNYGFRPIFLLALDEDPLKCHYQLNSRFFFDDRLGDNFRAELAKMCAFMGKRSLLGNPAPRAFTHLSYFKLYHKILGFFHYRSAHFYRINNAFSSKLNQRLYQIILRQPGPPGKSNFVIVGLTFNQFSRRMLLKETCQRLSDKNIKVSFGHSQAKDLPLITQEKDHLILLTGLPGILGSDKNTVKGQYDEAIGNVISYSFNVGELKSQLQQAHRRDHFALSIFGLFSLMLALLISFERLQMQAKLSRVIVIAFFASICLPLIGLAWLGVSHSITDREHSKQQILQVLEQRVAEIEQALLLQRYRKQLFFKIIATNLEQIPMKNWEKVLRRFSLGINSQPYRRHFNNFYLYNSNNKEIYRGQLAQENYRQNELPNVFGGPSRRLLLKSGSFAALSESERQKITQIADLSAGVMDQIIDMNFLNSLWGDPGNLTYASILARRDMFANHFLHQNNSLAGLMVFGTDNLLTLDIVEAMIDQGLYTKAQTINGHKIDINIYPISDFHERQLRGKLIRNDTGIHYIQDSDYPFANALYGNSDVCMVDNLHLEAPHLIFASAIFDKSDFVFARATPINNQTSGKGLSLLLAILAIVSSLGMASGVAKVLLLPVTPLLRAIKEISQNRFSWDLNLKNGAEFGLLSNSINAMKTKLLERQKIMQLVSKNAIEASRSNLEGQTTPQKRRATILFSDIRDFTTISENYSAEDVVIMLNSYFTQMCPLIEKHGGFVDKIIGDAIQAVFYGDDDKKRVLSACRAALEMRQNLTEYNRQRQSQGVFAINNGIGIASGIITTGLVGSSTGKLEVVLIGKTLNEASQLEAKSKNAKNSQILLDSASYELVQDKIGTEKIIMPGESGSGSPETLLELLRIINE